MTDDGCALISALEKNLLPPQPISVEAGMVAAAVLVPIVFRDGDPRLIFTLRAMSVAHHKGQISFPGGAAEPGDDGPVQTALRETEEEIGLSPRFVRPLGCLASSPTLSAFVVTPVVGLVDSDATFSINPEEVSEVFELPLAALRNPDCHRTSPFTYGSIVRSVHHFEVAGHDVWGVTGEIVFRLISQFR